MYSYFSSFLMCLFILCSSSGFGQASCDCARVFKELKKTISNSYAGYSYNKNLYGRSKYNRLNRKLKRKSKSAVDQNNCTKLLEDYVSFFNDKHLNIISDELIEHLESSSNPPEFQLFKNGTISYLRLPSFDMEFKTVIDSIVLANHEHIINSEIFIIDVSDNEGGGDSAYASLIPYFYTNPIIVEGVDLMSSPGNIAELKRYLGFTDYFDEETLQELQEWLRKAEANPGKFVNVEPEQEYISDTTYQGPNVAIIISNCKSAAEGLVLDGKQSSKVTTFGKNSGGVRDFLNVRHQDLESCDITVGLPMTKSTRVPEAAIDGVGIPPDVRVDLKDLDSKIEVISKHFGL